MSRFVLQPARILQTRFVPDRTKEAVEWTFTEMRANLVPSNDLEEVRKLGMLRKGCFVGVSRHSKIPGKNNIFLLYPRNRVGDIAAIIETDATFPMRMESVYQVMDLEYDGRILDPVNTPQTAP